VICTLFIHEHVFTFKPLCLHSIAKILRNGPRAHFPFNHPGKYSLLVDPVIRESRVKKVLEDGGSSINVTFP
jgi:hypothetical protein